MKPYWLRHLAAWYLDLVLIGTFVSVAAQVLPLGGYHWPAIIVLWLLVQICVWAFGLQSFGYYAMGVVRDEDGRIIVDPDLKITAIG